MRINNDIVIANIKKFLELQGKSEEWVCKRANISEKFFNDFLNGMADGKEIVLKLNTLFRIKDPLYFYHPNFVPPKGLDEIM